MSVRKPAGKLVRQWRLHDAEGTSKETQVYASFRIQKTLAEAMVSWVPTLAKDGIITNPSAHAAAKLLLEGGIVALDQQYKAKYGQGKPPAREANKNKEKDDKIETSLITVRIRRELSDALEFWAPVLVSEGKIKNNSAYASCRYVLESGILALNEAMSAKYAQGALSA
jgi:hypothetical protein